MIVLVGASASGKTELAKILYRQYHYHKCITTTTRLPREKEKNDIDYHFVDDDTFLSLKSKDAFVEVTSYHKHSYGIQNKDVRINGVVIVDPKGANALVDKIGFNAFVVYLETSEPTRRQRMLARGESIESVENRMLNDRLVFNYQAFDCIHVLLKNESKPLSVLAQEIHEKYQSYIKLHQHS